MSPVDGAKLDEGGIDTPWTTARSRTAVNETTSREPPVWRKSSSSN